MNLTQPEKITGVKWSTAVNVSKDANLALFNDQVFDFSSILTASGNQNITGKYSFDNITSDTFHLKSINEESLSNFVRIAGTTEIQNVGGELHVDEMIVRRSLKIENRILNGCNLTNFLDVEDFRFFDNMAILNGTLMIEHSIQNLNLSSILQR